MSIEALTSSVASASQQLVKTANGEYTADSVSKDQADTLKLGLVKEKDGNYGTTAPASTAVATGATGNSSPAALSVLSSLALGGSETGS
jgi:hypothetical protein